MAPKPEEVKVEVIDTAHRLAENTLPLLLAEAVIGNFHPGFIVILTLAVVVTNVRLSGGRALLLYLHAQILALRPVRHDARIIDEEPTETVHVGDVIPHIRRKP